jgi:DUF1365 family protein
MMMRSALYLGHVMHRRVRPRIHNLRYSVFTLLLDLDEMQSLDQSLRLFRYNQSGILSFWDKDHGDGKSGDLRTWVDDQLRDAGRLEADMNVQVLCYPRIFGYVFNPLTVYFCYSASGDLRAILYEVSNTFNERHTYVIAVEDGASGPIRQGCAKELYVSPFIPLDCWYQFHIEPPREKLLIRINESDADGPLLTASFSGERTALTDGSLLKALLRYPLMTLKVTLGIHWEALRIWTKGVKVHRHKAASSKISRTIVSSTTSGRPRS